MTPPPPLSEITSSYDWKTLSDEDKRTVIGGWQQHATAFGEANVPGWSDDHAITIHNAGIQALTADYARQGMAQDQQESADEEKSLSETGKLMDMPFIPLPKPSGKGIIPSVVRGVENVAEGLETPNNAAIAVGLGAGLGPIVQTGVGMFFGKQMVQQGVQQIKDASQETDPSKRIEAYTEGALSLGLGALAGAHSGARPEFGGVESKEEGSALRGNGMSEEAINRITRQLAQQGLSPQIPYARESGRIVGPEVVDGLTIAKQRLLNGFADASKEDQAARQKSLDEIEAQLLQIPREDVNASAARVAEQGQPTATAAAAAPAIAALPSFGENKATSELVQQTTGLPVTTEEVAPATAVATDEANPARRLFNWGTNRPDTVAPGHKDYDTGPAGSWWFNTPEDGTTYGPHLHEADVTLRSPAVEETQPVSPALLRDMRGAMKEATGSDALPFELDQKISRGEPVTMTDLLSFTGREYADKISGGGKLNNRAARAAFTKVMEDHGFDGMILKDGTQTVAFRPEYVSNLKRTENAAQEPSSPSSAAPGTAATPESTAELPARAADGRVSPLDQLRQLEAEAQASAADAKAEKMVATLQKLGRLNRDSTKAVVDELRYYSDDELARLKEHLGAKDSEPKTIARAITGRDVLKETERPTSYKGEEVGTEARADAPEIEAQKDQFGEDYVGGPGAMGPREAAALEANRRALSIKNASVNERRVSEGNLRLLNEYRQSNPQTLETAERRMEADPKYVDGIIDGLRDGSKDSVNHIEEAALTYEMVRVKNMRDQWSERAADPNAPEIERAEARQEWEKNEKRLNEIDQATKIAGTSAGRALQIRQMQLYDDFTHAGIERQARAQKGESLTKEESDKFEKLSEEYKALQEHAAKMEEAASEGESHAEMARIYEAEIDDLQKQAAKVPKISKIIFDKAREMVGRLNERGNAARIRLREKLSHLSAGVDPSIVLDVAEIMAAHIGEIGLKSAEVSARVLEEFGDTVKPFLKAAWKKAKELIDAEGAPKEVKEAIKKTGVGKKEPTTGEVKAKIKSEAKAGDELSQKYVADLVRAHIKAGVHGENAVMEVVTKDVQEAYPNATERDVRRAYTEYGKVRFPSKEAVETEMRELRTLVRIQESIDRETEGLDSLHTGLQRDKATQAIREKQKQLNELLKKRQGPPSPEKLASRNEARKTALKNAIADLDKQLRTGEKPAAKVSAPYDAEIEQLAAERDAMRDKLREIEESEKPKKTESEKQIEQLGKQRQKIDDILSGKREATAPKPFEALSKEAETLKAEIQAMHELAAQMKRDANPKDPNAAREKAAIKRFEEAAKRYEEKLKSGDFSAKDKGASRPDTEKVAAARAVMEARREAYEAAKKAGRPVKTPDQIYNETRAKAIKKEMEELQHKLDTKDFTPKPKPIPKSKFAATSKAESDLRAKRQEIKSAIDGINYANRSPQRKVLDAFLNAYRFLTAETIMGHGGVGMMTHAGGLAWRPTVAKIYWRNFGRQFGMWANKTMHDQLVYKLVHDTDFETWKKAGASIDPEQTYTDYGMYAKWLGKFSAAGKRGFDALKLTRVELNKQDWNRVSDAIKNDPVASAEMRKAIAEMNNKATGATARNNSFESAMARNAVSREAFFAPKLYASRWSRALFDPIRTIGTAFDWGKATPAERKIASMRLRNAAEFAAAYVGALLTNQAILSATHSAQTVNLTDPTKKDWLKFKAGNKEIIADGGLLDPIRLMGQVVWGDIIRNRENEKDFRGKSRFKKATIDLGNYVRSKLNPSVGIVLDASTGQDFQGRALPTSIPHLLGGEKPKSEYKSQPPYGWVEWFMRHGPIPISQGTQVAYDEMRKRGMSDVQAKDILKGAAVSLIGGTGVHVSEDYSQKR